MHKRRAPAFAAALVGLLIGGAANAAENAVPSCHAALATGLVQPRPTREIFVFVDQTTSLDDALRADVHDRLAPLLKPGMAFTVASFSAYGQGRYATVISAGVTEADMPASQRNEMSVPKLKKLDDCLRAQLPFARKTMNAAIDTALAGSSAELANSEILASLKQLSARVAGSKAPGRTVVVVSDMIEHSGVTSFYKKSALRTIDPATEMAKVQAAGLIGNFGGTSVTVIGAGALPPGKPSARRGTAEMAALEAFWRQWFTASNAKLKEFGQPSLLQAIQ